MSMQNQTEPSSPEQISNPGYRVTGVKTFRGREGYGYNATLWRGEKKVAFVMDEGCGGEPRYEWTDGFYDTPEQKLLAAYAASLPPLEHSSLGTIPMDSDLFVEGLVFDADNERRLKRLCKTKTLFRVKGDEEGSWRTYAVTGAAIEARIVREHGEALEEILNRRFTTVV